ncbi:MAG TPA: hypothetical protein PK587_09165 [Syntrophales bacterium]|nr:hypothetical protein [Syntrophales bacterium]
MEIRISIAGVEGGFLQRMGTMNVKASISANAGAGICPEKCTGTRCIFFAQNEDLKEDRGEKVEKENYSAGGNSAR